MEDDLLESTETFWSDLINNQELSYMLTPDCRIASGFHQRAVGVNGIDNCLELLVSLQKSLSQAEVDPALQNLMLMKTGTQTRFHIKGKHMGKSFSLSFALEWCNGESHIAIVTPRSKFHFMMQCRNYSRDCHNKGRNSRRRILERLFKLQLHC